MLSNGVRGALQPLARGLLGKYAQPSEKPEPAVYALEDMLKELTAFSDEDWMPYVFSREPLNGKFQDAQRRRLMTGALECGRAYAAEYRQRYGTADAEVIARQMDMQVDYPVIPEKTDRVLFAEFREPRTIHIYMDAVKKAETFLKDPKIRLILTDKLKISRLLLAHELFHAVEEQNKDHIYTRIEKIRLWSMGPLHNDSPIIVLSEIAAMAFAGELEGLPYAPWVMDVFLVYGYSPSEASGLYEEMMSLAGKALHAPTD